MQKFIEMKNNSFTYLKKWMLPVAGVALLSLGSCTANFEDINSDKSRVPTEDLNKDNLWAAYIQSMQQSVMAEDPNGFQRSEENHGNAFAGYIGFAQNWNGGNNSLNYYFGLTPGWQDDAFAISYGSYQHIDYPVPGVMNSWNVLRQRVDSTSVVFAVGEVVKVTAMHRVTDMYGPIPYTRFGKELNAPYDSQETVYKTFFTELDHAIDILTDYYTSNPGARPISKFDMVYESDILKWIKYANSLKLRLAMRIRYVEPELAKTYANQAVSHTYGVIEDVTGSAMIKRNSIYPFTNPMHRLWETYGESRMGATMESFLKGYNDPRIGVYFSPSERDGTYHGIRLGVSSNLANYAKYSSPNVQSEDPLYWMTAAEVYFLRAEGAMLTSQGWDMGGTPSELYNKGIETAMAERGITGGEVSTYMNDSSSKPAEYRDPLSSSNNILYGNANLSTITIKWDDSSTEAEKMERIMTQKWLATFPNGQEAWSEFRRTGYPKVFPGLRNLSGGAVPTGEFIKRLPLPNTEYANNAELVNKAVTDFLGGTDSPGQKLWWDARN